MRIAWSYKAVKDLDRIYEFYAAKNLGAAAKIYNDILDETEVLRYSPRIAAMELLLEEFPKTYRSLVVSKGRFKVIHFLEENRINISRVWDCRQDPQKLIDSFRDEEDS